MAVSTGHRVPSCEDASSANRRSVRSRCRNETPRSFAISERSIVCAGPSCDRKFKPLVLGQIETAADTMEKSSPLTPKSQPRWGHYPILPSPITRGNAASTNTLTASSGSTSQKVPTSLFCPMPMSKGVEDKLNSCPRKILGYQTPREIFFSARNLPVALSLLNGRRVMLAGKLADLLGKALVSSRELRVAPLLRCRPIRSRTLFLWSVHRNRTVTNCTLFKGRSQPASRSSDRAHGPHVPD